MLVGFFSWYGEAEALTRPSARRVVIARRSTSLLGLPTRRLIGLPAAMRAAKPATMQAAPHFDFAPARLGGA